MHQENVHANVFGQLISTTNTKELETVEKQLKTTCLCRNLQMETTYQVSRANMQPCLRGYYSKGALPTRGFPASTPDDLSMKPSSTIGNQILVWERALA